MAKPPKEPKERKALRAKMRGKAALLTGRQRKELAMARARKMAAGGGYSGFTHVMQTIARDDDDAGITLRLWASVSDRDAIDIICAKWLRAQKR